jgi:hypothetical protein
MRLLLGLLLTMVTVVAAARADLIFTLDSPTFSGAPGNSVAITGTLLNPDPNPVSLTDFSGLLTSPDLDFDLTDFFTVVPSVLNNGDSYAGPIVAVVIDPLAQSGNFFGSITLQGGADSNAFDDLATQNFEFSVSSVPEPSALIILIPGVLAIITARFRRRPDAVRRRVQ